MTTDSKILTKVKKLLNLSEDNAATNAEKELAFLKAQEIMIENNLSMEQIDKTEIGYKKIPIIQVIENAYSQQFGKIWYKNTLAHIIADNFRCELYLRNNKYVFIGFKNDIEIAMEVFLSAFWYMKHNASKLVQRSIKNYGTSKGVEKGYLYGFLTGLKDKFKEQVEKKGWGLILVKDNAIIEKKAEITKGCRTCSCRSRNTRYDFDAYEKGKFDGQQFNYQKKAIMIAT